jgi:hypothetical protein
LLLSTRYPIPFVEPRVVRLVGADPQKRTLTARRVLRALQLAPEHDLPMLLTLADEKTMVERPDPL